MALCYIATLAFPCKENLIQRFPIRKSRRADQ